MEFSLLASRSGSKDWCCYCVVLKCCVCMVHEGPGKSYSSACRTSCLVCEYHNHLYLPTPRTHTTHTHTHTHTHTTQVMESSLLPLPKLPSYDHHGDNTSKLYAENEYLKERVRSCEKGLSVLYQVRVCEV